MSKRGSSLGVLAVVGLATGIAEGGTAEVGRGVAATSSAPLYYVSPSPDDAGASRLLYRKEDLTELPPNVPLTAISFDKRLSGALASGTLTIYIKNSTATSLANGPLSDALAGMTQVYTTATATLPATDGWVRFAFSTPFTYTGDALEITTVWDSMSGARPADLFWGYHPTGTVNTRLFNYGPDPLAPTDVLGTGSPPARPNTRFEFTTPAAGWLVVKAGNGQLLDGATYANNSAFANGVTVPQRLTLVNNGGDAITFASGAITFSAITGTTPSVTTGPPGKLAAGASADIELAHAATVASGTVGYTVAIASSAGVFDYRLQGAVFPASPEIDVNVGDLAGNFTRVPTGTTIFLGNVPIGVPRTLFVQVANTGSATLNLIGTTPVEIVSGPAVITSQAAATVNSGTDGSATLTVTCPAAGACNTSVRVVSNDANEPTYTLQINSIAITPPAAGQPEIAVARMGGIANGGTDSSPGDPLWTITNVGTGTLTLGAITYAASPTPGVCQHILTQPTSPNLSQGDSTTFSILLDPNCGESSTLLTIPNNDDGDNPFRFTYQFFVPIDAGVDAPPVVDAGYDSGIPEEPSRGGGCGGCNTGEPDTSALLGLALLLIPFARRTRRGTGVTLRGPNQPVSRRF